ncbi:MAG: hypothetical protein ACRD2Y_07450 [Terriglobales bacterium]
MPLPRLEDTIPRMRRPRWLPLLCLALTSSVWPQNDERILDYHSDIAVKQDGSMDVRETIKVAGPRSADQARQSRSRKKGTAMEP